MCTAIQRGALCGRTLDYEFSYEEQVVITPRRFPFLPHHEAAFHSHYALIGMAYLQKNFPLYYDAMNEKGLWAAALAFEGNAHYFPPQKGALNLASFEVIPYLLSRCGSLEELQSLLSSLCITIDSFDPKLPPSPLHWIFSDKEKTLVVESTKDGLHFYENPAKVLANNPPFPYHLNRLGDFAHLSGSDLPRDLFPELAAQSRGMGALGLPGDLSSSSRFVRGAVWNRLADKEEKDPVGQLFKIFGSLAQIQGCVCLPNGKKPYTIYTGCCHLEKGVYYYSTAQNERIIGVDLWQEDLDGKSLKAYPLLQREQLIQNAPCQSHPS